MTTENIKAGDLRPGDHVCLDFGYGPHADNIFCEVLSVVRGKDLFGSDAVHIEIPPQRGVMFSVGGFPPHNTVAILERMPR